MVEWKDLNLRGKLFIFFNTIPCAMFGRENIPISDSMLKDGEQQ